LLTFFNIREMTVDAIPLPLKHAISVGIGLFIAFIGLQNGGLVISSSGAFLKLNPDFSSPDIWVLFFGTVLTASLMV